MTAPVRDWQAEPGRSVAQVEQRGLLLRTDARWADARWAALATRQEAAWRGELCK